MKKEMQKRKNINNGSNRRVRINSGGIEANTLAIIDSVEFHKDSQDAKDDRIDFLEAVRNASIVPEDGAPPTEKMVEAVFQILKAGESLELIMSSYELLNEIGKRFPRVYISQSSNNSSPEMVVVDQAWLPFRVSSDSMSIEIETTQKNSSGLFDVNGFHEFIQGLAELANGLVSQRLDIECLRNMLLFQYLVNVLEEDFTPRANVHKETMNWNLVRECVLNMLLASRRVNYKGLMKDCLSTICGLYQDHTGTVDESEYSETCTEKSSENLNTDVAIALTEVQKNTCMAMQNLMIMIMELDMLKKKADMQGQTSRTDGTRTPLVEIILDELTYDRDMLPPFLQAFNNPKWKLEIIVQYFLKYTAKPSFRTRRSNDSSEDPTFIGVLKSFSNDASTKNIIRKMDAAVVQLLLSHAFQAYLSMSSQQRLPGKSDYKDDLADSSHTEISKNMITTFKSLRRTDKNIKISSLGKEALFTAAMILSTTS